MPCKKMVCACWMQTVYGLFSFLEEKKLHTEHFSCHTLGSSFPPLLSLYLAIRSILFSLASQQEFNWFVFVFVSFSCIQIQFICAIGFSRQLSHLKWNALPFPRFHNFNGIFFSLVYMKWSEVSWHSNVRHLFLSTTFVHYFFAVIFTILANCFVLKLRFT